MLIRKRSTLPRMVALTRILFLAANPTDKSQLQLVNEINRIDEELLKAGLRVQFELEQRHEVRISQLQELLLRFNPQIVHFTGHGKEESALVFIDEQNRSQVVPPAALTIHSE